MVLHILDSCQMGLKAQHKTKFQMGIKSPESVFPLDLRVDTIELQAETVYHSGMRVSLHIPPAFSNQTITSPEYRFSYRRNILEIDSVLLDRP